MLFQSLSNVSIHAVKSLDAPHHAADTVVAADRVPGLAAVDHGPGPEIADAVIHVHAPVQGQDAAVAVKEGRGHVVTTNRAPDQGRVDAIEAAKSRGQNHVTTKGQNRGHTTMIGQDQGHVAEVIRKDHVQGMTAKAAGQSHVAATSVT